MFYPSNLMPRFPSHKHRKSSRHHKINYTSQLQMRMLKPSPTAFFLESPKQSSSFSVGQCLRCLDLVARQSGLSQLFLNEIFLLFCKGSDYTTHQHGGANFLTHKAVTHRLPGLHLTDLSAPPWCYLFPTNTTCHLFCFSHYTKHPPCIITFNIYKILLGVTIMPTLPIRKLTARN